MEVGKNFFEKNILRVFACIKNVVSLQRQNKNNGLWCNGNTTDSGPVILGSNPGSPAIKKEYINRCVPFLVNGCFQTGARQGGSACAISVSRLQLRVNPKSMAMRRGVRATRPVAPTSGTTGCLLSVFVYRLDYDLTKCQTKALRVPFLAPKYSLVDFVAFSGDSQNTDCCCMGNFLSFLSVLLGRKATFVIHTIRVALFLLPSDLLTAPFF